MSDLIKIAEAKDRADANVVFVHGLGAHPYWTWGEEPGDGNLKGYWPLWVADEFSNIDVWVMSYAAPKTNWFGSALELEDRVKTVMARIRTTKSVMDKPTAFVCHSLGGLLIKSLLRKAAQSQSGDAGYDALITNTKGITFVATPHLGASMARFADRLRFICWPSLATLGLTKNSSYLRELNAWFENWKARPKVLVFYGTEDKIVEISSANPALPHVDPIPLEGDHSSVCHPRSKNSLLPQTVFDFLKANLPLQKTIGDKAAYKPTTLPPIERRKIPILPFVVRAGFLAGLVALIGWFALSVLRENPGPPSGTPGEPPYERPGEDLPPEIPSDLPAGYRSCAHVILPAIRRTRAQNNLKIKLKDQHGYVTDGTFGDTNYRMDTTRQPGEANIYTFRILVQKGPRQANALCERLKKDGQACTVKPGKC